jgi:hypothetical protein
MLRPLRRQIQFTFDPDVGDSVCLDRTYAVFQKNVQIILRHFLVYTSRYTVYLTFPRPVNWLSLQDMTSQSLLKQFFTDVWIVPWNRLRLLSVYLSQLFVYYNLTLHIPQERRALERPRHRCEDNIKMNIRTIGWSGVNWIHLAQDRNQWWTLVITIMN